MENLKPETRAGVLVEALPYLQDYYGKIVVVKYGGNAMINEELKQARHCSFKSGRHQGRSGSRRRSGDRGTLKEDGKRVQIHQGTPLHRPGDHGGSPDGPLRKAQ